MIRTLGFSLGVAAAVFGAALTVQGLQREAISSQQRERRLDPSSPLIAAPASADVRMGARLARLQIPTIGVDEIVVEGVSPRQLAIGAGHYPGTAPVGGRGSVGIAGHRTGWGDPFLRLDELERGDRIVLQTRRDRFIYRVTNTKVVNPDARWVLNGDPKVDASFELTLTTCTPVGTARDRLIVWAERAV